MTTLGNRLGNCEVCDKNFAKYTCPKCEVKTCALKCADIHKKELNCDGIRDKTKYVPLSKFTNLDLLSDYRLLEDVTRSVENLKKDKSKNFTRVSRNLPRIDPFNYGPNLLDLKILVIREKIHLHVLKEELDNRNTKILFMPANFTRHKENTTFIDFKSKIIYWRIEWIFVLADNLSLIDERCDENLRIAHIIDEYLDPVKYTNDKLKFYQSVGQSRISLYLKAEIKPGNKYYYLDSYLCLKECFKNKTILEYPTIYVSFKDHTDLFETIESDDELSTTHISNPAEYLSKLVQADEKNAPSKGSLMFISEYSDGELLSSDEN